MSLAKMAPNEDIGFDEYDRIDEDNLQEEDEEDDDDESDDEIFEYIGYTPPSDLWSFSFYQYLRFADSTTCQRCMAVVNLLITVLFLSTVQGGVAFVIMRGTSVAERGAEPIPVALYDDVLDRLWQSGLPQMSSNDAEKLCGEFDDNYGPKAFSFDKLPLKNWQVAWLDETRRSTLDNAIYLMKEGTAFHFIMLAVGFLWIASIAKECFDIQSYAKVLYQLPSVDSTEQMVSVCEEEDGNSTYQIHGLTVCARAWGFSLVVIRTLIAIALFTSGCAFLIFTSSLIDLILNTLGLLFILEIDAAIFLVFSSTAQQKFMEHVAPVSVQVSRDWGFCSKWCHVARAYPISFQATAMAILASLGTCAIRWLQIWYASLAFDVVSAMCLFLGPTPNNLDQYEGVFPAVGFCESLLETECELPKGWQDLQCLFGKAKASTTACAWYTEPIGSTWPVWQKTATQQKFCNVGGRNVSAPLAPGHQKYVDSLRSACQSMWQTAPALNVTRLHASVVQFPPPPPVNSTWRLEPFARMRDTHVAANTFAAPFACPRGPLLEKALGLHQAKKPNWMKKFFLTELHQPLGTPWPAALSSTLMQDALKECRNKPIIVRSGGHQGAACTSHAQCPVGFCSILGACENGGCALCKTCSSGVHGTCGKCDPVCVAQEKAKFVFNERSGFIPVIWTVHLDQASYRWFYYNNVTSSSKWPARAIDCSKNVAGACASCAEQTLVTKSKMCIMCRFGFSLTGGHCNIAPITSIGAGAQTTVVVTADGSAWAAGYNGDGELGNNSTTSRNELQNIIFPQRVREVDASGYFTVLLADDGSAWGCGSNWYGQLGTGTSKMNYHMVTRINVTGKVASVKPGSDYTLLLLEDRSVWAVGRNLQGQLGDNSTKQRLNPVRMLVQAPVLAACGGQHHSILLLKNMSVLASGWNAFGQLGDNSTTNRLIPILMMMQSPVAAITAGHSHTILLLIDGTVWGTGRNHAGQLGTGLFSDTKVPVQMALPAGFRAKAVAAGGWHTLVLLDNGQVWGAGANNAGQLGIGILSKNPPGIATPVKVNLTGPAKDIAAWNAHSVFLLQDGTVMTVGMNNYGGLADGTQNLKSTPGKIAKFRLR